MRRERDRSAGVSPAPRMIASLIAAFALAACPARLGPVERLAGPVVAAVSMDRPGAIASIQPADEDGMALLVVTVAWPERGRAVASIHPSTERITFELKGPGQLPGLAELTRPGGGSLVKATSVKLPVVEGVEIRATAFAGSGAVVGLSLWTPVRLRRNARVDVPVELLPASGPDPLTATLLAPTVAGVSPDRGYPQQTDVTIRGANFGFGQGFGSVKFGGQDAGQASGWTDSILGGSTISIQVPPGAKTGPVQVRLGGSLSNQAVAWPSPGSGGGDPWSGHFTVLGPAGEPTGIDTGTLSDHQLAWDGTRFWIFWTKGGGSGMVLNASTLTPDSLTTVSSLAKGATIPVATAQGIQLGGFMTDAGGAWISWQETGAAVKMAHVTPGGAVDNVVTLTNSPAASAQPVVARATDGRLLAAWVDSRHTPSGGPDKLRVYAVGFSASGAALGPAIPAQESNGPVGSSVSRVGTPSIAVGQASYLVGWQETVTDTWSLIFQAMSFSGNRLYTAIGGWGEAGANDPQFQNESLAFSRRSLEELELLHNPRDQEFVAGYLNRLGTSNVSSDIYLHRLDVGGKPLGEHHQVADDTRQQGRAKCPSFDPGTPCGQGFRHKPRIVWNGRDYMVAWQMNRDDGEIDILGARLQRDAQGSFLRSAEEPPSPRSSVTYPRSVAEIFYSFEPNRTGVSMPGAQTLPRLAWGADVMLVGWIEPRGDQSAVVIRLWR